jgi:hypothetical protein
MAYSPVMATGTASFTFLFCKGIASLFQAPQTMSLVAVVLHYKFSALQESLYLYPASHLTKKGDRGGLAIGRASAQRLNAAHRKTMALADQLLSVRMTGEAQFLPQILPLELDTLNRATETRSRRALALEVACFSRAR